MIKKIVALVAVTTGFLVGCSAVPTPSEQYAQYPAEKIYQIAEEKLASHHDKDAVQAFEGLDALYPFNKNAQQAQLDIIYAYYQVDNMVAASAAAERYIRLYPRDKNVDYAYYMRGIANFNQDRGFFQRYFPVDQSVRDPGTMSQSYEDFKTLLKLFPNSIYAPDAKQHLIYLRNTFAKKNEAIASFYYQKQAYVAAIDRANEVLIEYDDTPSAKQALIILYNAYQKLGLKQSAAQTLSIIQLNYPGTSLLFKPGE